MKPGNLNFLEPSGPLQACKGTALRNRLFAQQGDAMCSSVEPTQLPGQPRKDRQHTAHLDNTPKQRCLRTVFAVAWAASLTAAPADCQLAGYVAQPVVSVNVYWRNTTDR
jgi:hypothetical protein